MIEPAEFTTKNSSLLEDFWRRSVSRPLHTVKLEAYGYPLIFRANDERLLKTALSGARRYSQLNRPKINRSLRLDFAIDPDLGPAVLPPHLPSQIRYLSVGNFLSLSAEPWLQAAANLEHWEAYAQISARLVERPYMLSRYVMDCFVSNMMLRTGWGQLHASCVIRDGKAVLLSAPHNSGKSTTAFRLLKEGYKLISDGMTYTEIENGRVRLMGYPVGEIKLRKDIANLYSDLDGHLEPTLVRNEEKLVIDLRRLHPDRVLDEAVQPKKTVICLLDRSGQHETTFEQIDPAATLSALWVEALHLDDQPFLEANLKSLVELVSRSTCYRLSVGTDTKKIVRAVDAL